MRSVGLCICDPDERYLKKLEGFIASQKDSPFIVTTCKSIEEVPANAPESGIVLISSELAGKDEGEAVKALNAGRARVVILNEGTVGKEILAAYETVYKYRPAKEIFGELTEICFMTGDVAYDEGASGGGIRPLAVCIFSPDPGADTYGYALELCGRYTGKKVLFIDMDDFPAQEYPGEGLTELLYYTAQGNANIKRIIERMAVVRENVYIIPPAACPMDARCTSESEWKKLMESVGRYCDFGVIAVHIKQLPYEPEVLGIFDQIVMPIGKSSLSDRYKARFRSFLSHTGNGDLERRISEVNDWNVKS
ncbi:MAG: hypothetical protein K5771_09505 [Oscillospiraceae bacterium]|nr:hypothetical protein [Oscillospiraceae bacterium]